MAYMSQDRKKELSIGIKAALKSTASKPRSLSTITPAWS